MGFSYWLQLIGNIFDDYDGFLYEALTPIIIFVSGRTIGKNMGCYKGKKEQKIPGMVGVE